jgi:very-short-patch-repair endonuclease
VSTRVGRGWLSRTRTRKALTPAEQWARAEAAAKRRALEDRLAQHIHAHKLPIPAREHRFHETRGWRFDFAWPEFKVAAEVEGLTRPDEEAGRHQRIGSYDKDTEKYNAATAAGWKLYRFTPSQVKSGYAVLVLRDALEKAARERGGKA